MNEFLKIGLMCVLTLCGMVIGAPKPENPFLSSEVVAIQSSESTVSQPAPDCQPDFAAIADETTRLVSAVDDTAKKLETRLEATAAVVKGNAENFDQLVKKVEDLEKKLAALDARCPCGKVSAVAPNPTPTVYYGTSSGGSTGTVVQNSWQQAQPSQQVYYYQSSGQQSCKMVNGRWQCNRR